MIKVNNISFKYFDNIIFNNASFSLPSKGVFLLKGNNGSGKTTLFKIIFGKLKLNNGSIQIDNLMINNKTSNETLKTIKNNILYIPQEGDFIDFLNAKENANLDKMLEKNKSYSLSFLNNKEFENKNINQLSNGEKILISLEKLINTKKKIVLLDEITDYIDSNNTKKIIDIIKKASKESLILIITHDERIIKEFSDSLLIKDKKIKQNYNYSYIENTNHLDSKEKSIKSLCKLFIKRNKILNIILCLILSIFTSISLFFLSVTTYPYCNHLNDVIGNGYYTYAKKYSDLKILDYNITNKITSFSYLSTNDIEIVVKEFDCNVFEKNNILLSKDLSQNGKIKISKEEYENEIKNKRIINNKIKINLYYFNTYALLPFEVLNNDEFINEYQLMMNKDDYQNIVCNSGISLYFSLWENNSLSFNTDKFFSKSNIITFISQEIFEQNNNELGYSINNNEIYISSYLSKYYIDSPVNFFPFSKYNLNEYDTSIFDLNTIFNNKMYLKKNDLILKKLKPNEVVISNENFKKLNNKIFESSNPIIDINKNTKSKYIQFSIKNDYKQLELIKYPNSKYSLQILNVFNDIIKNDSWFYIILYTFLFILEKWIIIVYTDSFMKKNNKNIIILSNYLSKKQLIIIFNLPLILCQITSFISAFFIVQILFKLFNNSISYNVPSVNLNIYSLILFTILFIIDVAIYQLVSNKYFKKIN